MGSYRLRILTKMKDLNNKSVQVDSSSGDTVIVESSSTSLFDVSAPLTANFGERVSWESDLYAPAEAAELQKRARILFGMGDSVSDFDASTDAFCKRAGETEAEGEIDEHALLQLAREGAHLAGTLEVERALLWSDVLKDDFPKKSPRS